VSRISGWIDDSGEHYAAERRIVNAVHEHGGGRRFGPNPHCSESDACQNGTGEAYAGAPRMRKGKGEGNQQNRNDLSRALWNSNVAEERHAPQKSRPRKSISSTIGPAVVASRNWLKPGNVPMD
jgi:hypothetical protein